MRILSPYDNALFIKNWRERMRSPSIISAVVLIAIIITLILVGCYLNRESLREYDYFTRKDYPIPWLNLVFFQLAVLQGIILLLFATRSTHRMAFQERVGGTLEFHRCSPTSRLNQAIGMVLGAPILEWCVFLGSLLISVIIAFIIKIKLFTFIGFYLGLILSAMFFHSIAVLVAISSNQLKNRWAGLPFFFLILFFGPFFYYFLFYSIKLSSLYHMTWFPAYDYLWKEIIRGGIFTSPYFQRNSIILHSFFGQKINFLLLQAIVQLPLIGLIWAGIRRKISYAEKSVLSKTQSALFNLLVLFYYCGSAISVFLYESSIYYWEQFYFAMFFYFILGLTILGALTATPTYLSYTKGLCRMRKLGLRRLSLSDDQNSNMLWLIALCSIVTVAYFIIRYGIKVNILDQIYCLIVLLCQIVFFASALEFFQLSRFHQKKIFFWTAMAILWFIVPIFGLVTSPIVTSKAYMHYFFSPSPIFGTVSLTEMLSPHRASTVDFPIHFSMVINFILTVIAVVLALRERQRLSTQILTK
jgi:hypothetical protein